MVTLTCQNCEKDFEVEDWRARRGQKYCSVECANEAKKGKTPPGFKPGKVTLTCQQCGKEFKVWKAWLRRGRRKFCSWDCKAEYQKTLTGEKSHRQGVPHTEETKAKMRGKPKPAGENHHGWKGGKWKGSHGYRMIHTGILKPETRLLVAPMTPKSGYIAEHRLVMAVELERPLARGEQVHHLNGDKMDNRPENLQLFPVGSHSRKHRQVDRELSRVKKENEQLKAEVARLKSLLATYQSNG